MNKRQLLVLSVISAMAFNACKKTVIPPEQPKPDPVVVPVVTTPTRQQLSLDSIYLYAQQIYYWNNRLPAIEVFNPRQYTVGSTDLINFSNEVFNVAKYSEPFEYKPGDKSAKFSYVFDKANKNATASINAVSSVDLEGNGNDLGIRFGLYGSNNDYKIYITAVYDNSPAAKLGFARGDVVTKINGVRYGSNYPLEENPLNAGLSATSVTIEGFKADGTTPFNATLTKALFKSKPIYKTKVLNAEASKIGYFAYARFSNAENSIDTLDKIFKNFAAEGVSSLVIDLRYNGGGYVSTAEHLINLITPSSTNGVMFSEYYNNTMQSGQATILKNQPLLDGAGKVRYGANGKLITYADINYSLAANTINFAKKGPLGNITKVVFLVSGNTASASELVINSLKPHMSVTLVGQTTYGKPIGFFPVTIENKYDVYFSLFETKNSSGQGGYYAGMVPDFNLSELVAGDKMYDFGDPKDNYLKRALTILAPGVVVTSGKVMSQKLNKLNTVSSSNIIPSDFSDREFKGMIENRFKIKD